MYIHTPLLYIVIMADTDTQQPKIIAVSAVMLFLSTASVALRLVARSKSGVGFWWDDWCAIFATVGIVLLNSLIVLMQLRLCLIR